MGIKVNLAKTKNLFKKGLVGRSVFFGFFIFERMADEFLKFSNRLNSLKFQKRLNTILSKPNRNLYTPPSYKIFGRIQTTTIRAPVKGASDFLGYW